MRKDQRIRWYFILYLKNQIKSQIRFELLETKWYLLKVYLQMFIMSPNYRWIQKTCQIQIKNSHVSIKIGKNNDRSKVAALPHSYLVISTSPNIKSIVIHLPNKTQIYKLLEVIMLTFSTPQQERQTQRIPKQILVSSFQKE